MYRQSIKIESVSTVNLNPIDYKDLYEESDLVDGSFTSCGHSVKMSILEKLGFEDPYLATCHHCLYYEGDISDDKFKSLCEIEGV